jgi:hypothetical protein
LDDDDDNFDVVFAKFRTSDGTGRSSRS